MSPNALLPDPLHAQRPSSPSGALLRRLVMTFAVMTSLVAGAIAGSFWAPAGAPDAGSPVVDAASPSGETSSITPWPTWADCLVRRESGGRLDIVNSAGFSGPFQFGEAAVAHAGVYSDTNVTDNIWNGTFTLPSGSYSYDQWLHSWTAQLETADAHFAQIDKDLATSGLDRWIGQSFGEIPVTRAGLRFAVHLGGLAGTKRLLNGGGDAHDSNGTRVSSYLAMGSDVSVFIASAVEAP